MTVHLAANAAELLNRLAAASGGDRIELAGGDYGAVSIANTFTSDVTIASADMATPAVFTGLNVRGAAHIVFDGITLHYVPRAGDPQHISPFSVAGSGFIVFRNCTIFSDGVGGFGHGYGLLITDSDDCTAENCEIHTFYRGILAINCDNFTIQANDMWGFRSDGINIVGSPNGALIEGNWIHDFKIDPSSGDHPDMIQFWASPPGGTGASNTVIRGNFLDAGVGYPTQSMFIWDGSYTNLRIEDNVIYNDHIHGITTSHVDGLTIRNNTLLHDLHVKSPFGWAPKINIANTSTAVTAEKNISEGSVSGDNLRIGAGDYATMFVNATISGPALDDLRAIAGGTIENGGYGAAMTRRLNLPLLTGPQTAPPVPVPNVGPVANFFFTTNNLVVDFTDVSTDSDGIITEYDWNFGDGVSSTLANPSHTYLASGTYIVSLTVTDDAGATDVLTQTLTVTAAVVVPPAPNVGPVANFSFTTNDLTVSFTDASTDSDGTIVIWDWAFGDGAVLVGAIAPVHTYPAPGPYNCRLTVTDDDGAINSITQIVTVTAVAPDPIPPLSGITPETQAALDEHTWAIAALNTRMASVQLKLIELENADTALTARVASLETKLGSGTATVWRA